MRILFSQVLNMSLTANVIILCVLAARLLLKKAPKIHSYALWAVVLFRLLCPVSLASNISVLELTRPQVTQSEGISTVSYQAVEQVVIQSTATTPTVQAESVTTERIQKPQTQIDTEPSAMDIAAAIWLVGMAVMALHSIVTYLRLHRSLTEAVCWKDNIYLADRIGSPFVLGILRPKIYLPSDTPLEERPYIIAHERHHIRRFDHIIKLLAYTALCLHWINPLVWLAFFLAGKDMEMSCDEAVIKKLGEHIRADYSAALLRLATYKKIIAGTPLAFGEGDTKGRVLNMAKWKKPKVWVTVLCILICVLVLITCAVNPEEERDIADITRKTSDNPTGFGVGDLNFTLPGGITHEMRDREKLTAIEELAWAYNDQEKRSRYVTVFSVDGVEIGGTQDHILPEGTDLSNPQSWPEHLDLWEWEDETLAYSGGSSPYADYELHFDSDVPDPGNATVKRSHYLFLSDFGARVYDMWFDMTVVEEAFVEDILRTADVGYGGCGKGSLDYPEIQRFGSLQLTVPTGYGYKRTGDEKLEIFTRSYWKGEITVAGVDTYDNPDISIQDKAKWAEALGLPVTEEQSLLAPTVDPPYGDLLLWVDDISHYFYIHGDVVYDLWFDDRNMEEATKQAILESASIFTSSVKMDVSNTANVMESGENVSFGTLPEVSSEEESLANCKAVLELVQSSESYHILEQRVFTKDVVLTTPNTINFRRAGENFLYTNYTHNMEPDQALFARLRVDGRYYDNQNGTFGEAQMMDESGQSLWTETTFEVDNQPWLASFLWQAQEVIYISTLPEDGGEAVFLRICAPHEFDGEIGTAYDHYYATFHFDTEGNFSRVEIKADFSSEDLNGNWRDFSVTQSETIVSLNDENIAAEIEKEYQRTSG